MQLSQPLPIGARPAMVAADPADLRMSESKARARRWWAVRSTILLAASAVGLCLFVIWRRDCVTIEAMLQTYRQPVAFLQSRVDDLGVLPATLPPDLLKISPSYADATDRFFAVRSGGPAIVAAGPPIPLILRNDGRCIAVYDHGKISREWVTEAQFRARVEDQIERTKAFERERRARPPELP